MLGSIFIIIIIDKKNWNWSLFEAHFFVAVLLPLLSKREQKNNINNTNAYQYKTKYIKFSILQLYYILCSCCCCCCCCSITTTIFLFDTIVLFIMLFYYFSQKKLLYKYMCYKKRRGSGGLWIVCS
jgi:hypothetical protein